MNPDLVLADELTGNLSTRSADCVFELMRQVTATAVPLSCWSTHNLDLARRCARIVEVFDGRIAGQWRARPRRRGFF
jgi:lipoprotein-releasing system ATP-binding protein